MVVERDVDQVQPSPGNLLKADFIDLANAMRRIDDKITFAESSYILWLDFEAVASKAAVTIAGVIRLAATPSYLSDLVAC